MPDDQLLNQLKSKYQAVISAAPQLGIRLNHVHIQDGKLYIQGDAPNEQIKNELWNKIKAVDPSYSDLTADVRIDSSLPAPQQAQAAGFDQVMPRSIFTMDLALILQGAL